MAKSQSLDRGLDVIELIGASQHPMGTREIARALMLSPAIVQRLLNTLLERNYIHQDAETRRYRIGYRMLSIGASHQASDALLAESRKELEKIIRQIRVDAYLGVLRQDSVIYLLCVNGDGPVTVKTEIGQRIPIHSTALGKVLLAAMTEKDAADLLGTNPLPAITARTITDPRKLVAVLGDVRERGYASVEDENILGISSVGAPVTDAAGRVCAAISVSWSRHFTPELSEESVAILVSAAARAISYGIGDRNRGPK